MTQLEAQSIYGYQARLLSAMDLAKNQLKLYFTHPISQSISFSVDFKNVNNYVNTKDIPLPENINLHMKIGELIYNDLSNTSLAASKAEEILRKVTD